MYLCTHINAVGLISIKINAHIVITFCDYGDSVGTVLKRSIISHSQAKLSGDSLTVKIQTLLLISITASFVLSLVATLASYNIINPSDPRILDVGWLYRGWPLHWMIESWSFWSPPPYPHRFTFQPVNFLVDFIFYAIVFQIPMQIYMYSKEARKSPYVKKQPNKYPAPH